MVLNELLMIFLLKIGIKLPKMALKIENIDKFSFLEKLKSYKILQNLSFVSQFLITPYWYISMEKFKN